MLSMLTIARHVVSFVQPFFILVNWKAIPNTKSRWSLNSRNICILELRLFFFPVVKKKKHASNLPVFSKGSFNLKEYCCKILQHTWNCAPPAHNWRPKMLIFKLLGNTILFWLASLCGDPQDYSRSVPPGCRWRNQL